MAVVDDFACLFIPFSFGWRLDVAIFFFFFCTILRPEQNKKGATFRSLLNSNAFITGVTA